MMTRKFLILLISLTSLSFLLFLSCDDNPVKPPVVVKEYKVPEITLIDPITGVPGQQITINGKNFGASRGSSFVLFGEVKPETSDYVAWNDSIITLKIPALALTGYIKVVVVYPDSTLTSQPVYFTIGTVVGPPFISRIKPDKAYAGDTVTIDGSNFLNQRDTNYVNLFGNKVLSGDYISWTSSKIIFRVPANATPGAGKIQVVVRNVTSNEFNFTVLQKVVIEPPVIDYIQPSTAKVGDTIRIYGSKFSDNRNYHKGYAVIGGVTVNDDNSFIDWKDDLILVKVPQGAKTGKLFVYKDDVKSNEVDFTLGTEAPKPPEITSLSKYEVKVNEFVDITGKNFGATKGLNSHVYLGDNKLSLSNVVSWSNTKISILVPSDAAPGAYELYVSFDGMESNRKSLIITETTIVYLVETVLIKAGTFTMGTSEDDLWGNPAHQVTLTKDFYMSKTEITQSKYQEVVSTWPDYLPDDTGPNKPANLTKWIDIVKWCNSASKRDGLQECYTINGDEVTCDFNKNGYRLPTEAEWEYACRAGTTGDVNFTGNLEDYAWIRTNSGMKLNDVGQKLPNPWGLYDMYGNAAEWVWDWLDSYSDTPVTDPKGPSNFEGNGKVLRGGSMFSTVDEIKSWSRTDVNPEIQDRKIGFRVVRNK
jgi:formylglycine-generating enzyme required for sulfatase activity